MFRHSDERRRLTSSVIAQGIVAGQDTSGWPPVLVSIITNIAPVIGIVAIIAMFIIVVKLSGGFGSGGAGGGGA